LTGIPKNTLVAWERRYGVLEPERLDNGYRVYSDEDVARIIQLKRWLDEGLKISEAVRMLGREESMDEQGGAPLSGAGYPQLRDRLFRSLTAYQRAGAEDVVQRLTGVAHGIAIREVFLPVLRRVGDAWAAGEVDIAQERFASTFLRDRLAATLLSLGCGPRDGMSVACVTFPEERHEIGALALAVRLATLGCRVTYLGADLPVEDLCKFLRLRNPAWICVSVVMGLSTEKLGLYATRLRQGAGQKTNVAIGGGGLPSVLPVVRGVQFVRDFYHLDVTVSLS
jgi:MerR family transcriptional regulator, light-induced transcriptional regulator